MLTVRFLVRRDDRVGPRTSRRRGQYSGTCGPGTFRDHEVHGAAAACTARRRQAPGSWGPAVLRDVQQTSAALSACSRSLRSGGASRSHRVEPLRAHRAPPRRNWARTSTRAGLPSFMRSLSSAHRHWADDLHGPGRGAARRRASSRAAPGAPPTAASHDVVHRAPERVAYGLGDVEWDPYELEPPLGGRRARSSATGVGARGCPRPARPNETREAAPTLVDDLLGARRPRCARRGTIPADCVTRSHTGVEH